MQAEGSKAPAGRQSCRQPPGHVLVLERDSIIGLGLAGDLAELGFRVSGPCISLAEVASVLNSETPDGAIIDVVLRDGAGIAAARLLRSHGVPIVFFSAGDRGPFTKREFADVPWIDKPAPTERLVGALRLRLPGGERGSAI